MEISQELEDRLVGIAVVNGHWYAAAYWLQRSGLLPAEKMGDYFSIVDNIGAKHSDLRIPTFLNLDSLEEYLTDCN